MLKNMTQKLTKNNMKKTVRYFKKNGIGNTFYAVLERMKGRIEKPYVFIPISKERLAEQCRASKQNATYKFSIIVPLYETGEVFLRDMIDSVLQQSYSCFELILVDASTTNNVFDIVSTYQDKRICYQRLSSNKGISENTNQALEFVTGDYVGLLDHDDMLAPNALYEMAAYLEEKEKMGISVALIYSDEDKTDEANNFYYEPHYKENFNLDLFLSNNYICHFTMIREDFIKELKFRKEYDGAQDFDLFLRVVARCKGKAKEQIVHLPKLLYHWRCHTKSTAENPESKLYAYEAGRRAVEDFCKNKGWNVRVEHAKHLGFYRIEYVNGMFENRNNVAAIGGPIIYKNKIVGGAMAEDGRVLYKGLSKNFSGYMHKASMQQSVLALHPANMIVNKQWKKVFEDTMKLYGVYEESNSRVYYDKCEKAGIEFGKIVMQRGGILHYDPTLRQGVEDESNDSRNS